MNPSKNEEQKTIRLIKRMIKNAANKADCAAEGVEEGFQARPEREGPPPEPEEPDHSCGVCGEGEESGIRGTVLVPTPYKPSQTEVDDHYLTHLPFRSWCGTASEVEEKKRVT